MAERDLPPSGDPQLLRIASWNCAGAFRRKVDRALALNADLYVIQEAEPLDRYENLLPRGTSTFYARRDPWDKGVLVVAARGWALSAQSSPDSDYAYVEPLEATNSAGTSLDLRAVWTLDARPREAAYVGQAHLALDALPQTASDRRGRRIAIGDYNSNAIFDHERVRNHTTLVERMAELGMISAYHSFFAEKQGEETRPTFFLQRNRSKAFHIDHCFTDLPVLGVEVGTYEEWSGLAVDGGVSDHCPLVVTLSLKS